MPFDVPSVPKETMAAWVVQGPLEGENTTGNSQGGSPEHSGKYYGNHSGKQ